MSIEESVQVDLVDDDVHDVKQVVKDDTTIVAENHDGTPNLAETPTEDHADGTETTAEIPVENHVGPSDESDEQSDFAFSDNNAPSDDDNSASSSEGEDDASEDGDVSDEEPTSKLPLKTAHELDKLPAVEPINLTIPENLTIVEIGRIHSIIDNMVIIEANPGVTETRKEWILDADSILLFENHDILGRVFETFGPVIKPMYSVRFNSADEIDRSRAVKDCPIFCSPDLAKYVFTQALKAHKGTDASNQFDEEVNESELEFSDDEEEANFKRKLKLQKKGFKFEEGELADDSSRKKRKHDDGKPSRRSNMHHAPRQQQQQYVNANMPFGGFAPHQQQHAMYPPQYAQQGYYSFQSAAYPTWQQGYVPFTNQMTFQPTPPHQGYHYGYNAYPGYQHYPPQ